MVGFSYFHILEVGLQNANIDFSIYLDQAIVRQRKLSRSNKLLHLKEGQLLPCQTQEYAVEGKALQILRFHNKYLKQYGINPTLQVQTILHWFDPQNSMRFISPVFCRPSEVKKVKDIIPKISFTSDEEWFVNPVLYRYFKEVFDITLDNVSEALQVIEEACHNNNIALQSSSVNSDTDTWVIQEDISYYGNFNYSSLYFEQDLIKIQNKKVQKPENTSVAKFRFITHFDESQRAFAEHVLQGHSAVLQGPPGTGKSQTITNIMASFAAADKKVLFVSAKKAAITVVEERLKENGLGDLLLTCIQPNENFYTIYQGLRNLIAHWEEEPPKPVVFEDQYLVHEDTVREFINAYSSNNLHLGMSLHEASKLITSDELKLYDLYLPSYAQWKTIEEDFRTLQKIYATPIWIMLADHFIQDQHNLEKWLDKVVLLVRHKALIEKIKNAFNLPEFTFETLQKYSVLSHSLRFISTRGLTFILNNKSKRKQLEIALRKLKALAVYQAEDQKFYEQWSSFPDKVTFQTLQHNFKVYQQLGFWSFQKRKLKKAIQKTVQQYREKDCHIPSLLEALGSWYQRNDQRKSIYSKIHEDLSIDLSESHLHQHIASLLKNINDDNAFYEQLKSQGNLTATLKAVYNNYQIVDQIKLSLRYLFINPFEINLQNVFLWAERVASQKNQIYQFKNNLFQLVNTLTISEKKALLQYTEAHQDIEDILLHNSFAIAFNESTILKTHSHKWLIEQLDKLPFNRLQSAGTNANGTYNYYHQKIHDIQQVILQKGSAASEQKKKLKKEWKKAKKFLTKEVYKKTQHEGLKSLIENSSSLFFSYHPIHLMSPECVAANLPSIQDLYDIVIFDEASQIPVDKALSAIYRSRQFVVVGDPEQMPPSQFFEKEGDHTESLLDITFSSLHHHMLRWHYRSRNPELIAFSNHYFYQDKLKVFPRTSSLQPFEYFEVMGTYANNVNANEAEAIIQWLRKHMDEYVDKSIGIVAFSKAQADFIESHLDTDTLNVYNLETVQGDENDIIVISMGYGYDPDQNFSLHFGPINQAGGAQRLNVLFSRAKEKIVVFNSIPIQALAQSTNEGVLLLYKYLNFVKSQSKTNFENPDSTICFDPDQIFNPDQDFVSYFLGLSNMDFELKFRAKKTLT